MDLATKYKTNRMGYQYAATSRYPVPIIYLEDVSSLFFTKRQVVNKKKTIDVLTSLIQP